MDSLPTGSLLVVGIACGGLVITIVWGRVIGKRRQEENADAENRADEPEAVNF